jgi:hypothetical protein
MREPQECVSAIFRPFLSPLLSSISLCFRSPLAKFLSLSTWGRSVRSYRSTIHAFFHLSFSYLCLYHLCIYALACLDGTTTEGEEGSVASAAAPRHDLGQGGPCAKKLGYFYGCMSHITKRIRQTCIGLWPDRMRRSVFFSVLDL